MLKKYLLIPVILLIIISGCEKKDPLTKMFNKAENLEAKIVQNYNSITACRMNYEKILIQAPESPYAPIACYKLAKLNEVFGHYDEALDYYRKLLSTYPDHEHAADGLLSMAKIYQFHENKIDDAIHTYQQFIAFYPENPARSEAYLQQANLLVQKKEFKAAAESYKKLFHEFPNSELNDDVCFRLGTLYEHQLKDSIEAITWYNKLVLDYSQSSWVQHTRNRLFKGGKN
jgi:TolA-binding protein